MLRVETEQSRANPAAARLASAYILAAGFAAVLALGCTGFVWGFALCVLDAFGVGLALVS